MSKPLIHAQTSAAKHGGKPEDYMDIHEFMDSSKAAFPDSRHRALTHNTWFIQTILKRVFGSTRTNSDGQLYSVTDIGEEHVMEDYKGRFIPSVQDFLMEMEVQDWMKNGSGVPESAKKVKESPSRGFINPESIKFD